MPRNNCPEVITIQAVVDGEEDEKIISDHLESCSSCRKIYREIGQIVTAANSLAGEARLPEDFYRNLTSKIEGKPLPAALIAAAVFVMAFSSAYFLNPGYLQWWLSVGMTRQFGFYIDIFMDIILIGRMVGPLWWVMALAAMVAFEVIILLNLKTMEGY